MNDDEINEIIARSDDEERIFREIDIQREREALEKWRAAGNRGKPPQPLIQLEELPDCYKSDEPFESKDDIDELEGRGHRRRAVVNYTDGLSDDQWAMVRFFCRRRSCLLLTPLLVGSGGGRGHSGARGTHTGEEGEPRCEQAHA